MIKITIRPVGTVDTKPIILLAKNLVEYFKYVNPIHKIAKETYGSNIKVSKEAITENILYMFPDGQPFLKIEVDKVDPEEDIKGVPNGA